MQATQVIAVPDVKEAGAIVMWWLSGTINAERLRAEWATAGLDVALVPDNPGVEAALRRAVGEQKEKRRLVRSLARMSGWAIVDEHASESEVAYRQECTIKADAVGRVVVEPQGHPLTQEIMAAFAGHLENLKTTDVSGWLSSLVRHLGAVALRDGGGVYFIPRDKLDAWRKMVGVVRSVSSHGIYEVPALLASEAVALVLRSIEYEAQAEAEAMEQKLDKELGARALETQVVRCSDVEKKVSGYEALLGTSMEVLKQRLSTLRSRLSEAALAAQAEVLS